VNLHLCVSPNTLESRPHPLSTLTQARTRCPSRTNWPSSGTCVRSHSARRRRPTISARVQNEAMHPKHGKYLQNISFLRQAYIASGRDSVSLFSFDSRKMREYRSQLRAYISPSAHAPPPAGVLYDNGKGVERCATKAVHYFTRSAELGSQWAMKNLGTRNQAAARPTGFPALPCSCLQISFLDHMRVLDSFISTWYLYVLYVRPARPPQASSTSTAATL
jgi:hypothetical protein